LEKVIYKVRELKKFFIAVSSENIHRLRVML
jgi:hypothetical protein